MASPSSLIDEEALEAAEAARADDPAREGGPPGSDREGASAASSAADAGEAITFPEGAGHDMTLLEAIEAGVLGPPPGPLVWNKWQSWRSGPGLRPPYPQDGHRRLMVGAEAKLWHATMGALFGPDWKASLPVRGAAAAPRPAAAPRASQPAWPQAFSAAAALALPPPPAAQPPLPIRDDDAASVRSECSWGTMGADDLAAVLGTIFDPKTEALSEYERRVARAQRLMTIRGFAFDVEAVGRAVLGAQFISRAWDSGRGGTSPDQWGGEGRGAAGGRHNLFGE